MNQYSFALNTMNSTQLAVFQDRLISSYLSGNTAISKQDLDSLRNNLWVQTAERIAPTNLAIRQYCLIDLYTGVPSKINPIHSMVERLSYGGIFWAEGYSYWIYTNSILEAWAIKFNDLVIMNRIKDIKYGFESTAYFWNGLWYPAPYGDLRFMSLLDESQGKCSLPTISYSLGFLNIYITKDGFLYRINGKPVGLNNHIPKNSYDVSITANGLVGFKFYTGIDTKYKSKWEALGDILHWSRIKSI